ncbi:MAG: GrpB family protein [Anaerolineae bacterium]|nr:GrpB family protein [Anaerolineae bacterium]
MSNAIVIADYDPAWPVLAAEEIARIRASLGDRLLAIEHVGSTSVPGLAAKPLLDLMGGLQTLDEARVCVPHTEALGYHYEPGDSIPDRVYFNKGPEGARTHHLYLVELGGEYWVRHIAFRDALRADPALAADYAALKRLLAAKYGTDRLGYTEAKSDFITAVEAKALRTR